MAKWWKAPEGVKTYKKKNMRSGKLGGVSPSENIDSANVRGYIVSGYTGDKIPLYDEQPFKLPLGTNTESIRHTQSEAETTNNGNIIGRLIRNCRANYKSSEFNYE